MIFNEQWDLMCQSGDIKYLYAGNRCGLEICVKEWVIKRWAAGYLSNSGFEVIAND